MFKGVKDFLCTAGGSCNVLEQPNDDKLGAIDIKYRDVDKDNLKTYVDLLRRKKELEKDPLKNASELDNVKENINEVHQYDAAVVNYFNALKEYYIGRENSITDEQVYDKILEHIRSK